MLNDIEQKNLLSLTQKLISFKSITPNQDGCMDFIEEYLKQIGFLTIRLDKNETSNLIAIYGNINNPIFAFAGHIDVVPSGDIHKWDTNPFILEDKSEHFYGRGIADMKGAISSFIISCEKFIQEFKPQNNSIAILLTSDEEGPATDGTRVMVDYLKQNNTQIKYCILGEPTSVSELGDTIKIGRRGSLTGHLEVIGLQGHIAYPHLCINPIHKFAGAINVLTSKVWDSGSEFFPPSSFQFTNLNSGIGVDNVTPGSLHARFNFRYNDNHTADTLQKEVIDILDQHKLEYKISWFNSAQPFITKKGHLSNVSNDAINKIMGIYPEFKTDGGTSDGRFLVTICEELLELGLNNKYIHQISERIPKPDLFNLANIYYNILTKIF